MRALVLFFVVAACIGCESIAGIRDYRAADTGMNVPADGADVKLDAPPMEPKLDAALSCVPNLGACEATAQCCGADAVQCFEFSSGNRCSVGCALNSACGSGGCCLIVAGRRSACGRVDECSPQCRKPGETCDGDEDCCDSPRAALCVRFGDGLPGECRKRCTDDILCADSGCCRAVSSGDRVCYPAGVECPER